MSKGREGLRYPGIRSFERDESQLFFGREQEAEELFSMIKVKPLTVLFAKSGIGKTSLLNAGVIPMLENEYFFPVKIRLQDTSISPVETIKQVLKPYFNQDKWVEQSAEEPHLWEMLNACEFKQAGEAFIPVLIFDQFEEFFSHSSAQQSELISILSDVINERLPSELQQAFRAIPRKERTEEQLEWYSPVKARVVFSIRSDRMSMLDDLKTQIPTVLHDRFHLRSLSQVAAQMAITAPAALDMEQFDTAPFTYSPNALEEMLSALSNEAGEVESFQLQLLCQYIEEKVQRGAIQNEVQHQDFGGQSGVQEILNDYYERAIGQLSEKEQPIARQFIEEGLIVNGKRVGVAQGVEGSRFGVGAVLLEKLLDSRLIRSETIHLGKIYELSHDTLVGPILASYETRRLKEEREASDRKIAEEKAKAEEANRKRLRARMYAILGFALFFLALLAGIFAYLKSQESKRNETRAKASELAAKSWLVYREDHTLALRLAEAALRIDPENEDVHQTMNRMVNLPNTSFYKEFLGDHSFEVDCATFSPDSKYLLTGSFDTDIILWDTDGNLIRKFKGKRTGGEGHGRNVTSLDFSPDGQRFVSSSEDRTVKIWSTAGELIKTLEGHRFHIFDVCYANEGQVILSASGDRTVKIWDAEGNELQSIKVANNRVMAIEDFPGKEEFACGILTGEIQIRRFDGTLIHSFQGNYGQLSALDISPDGQTIAAAYDNNTAVLWNRNGEQLAVLRGHSAALNEIEFSKSGQWVLTTSWDKTAKLWNLQGEELMTFSGHTEKVVAGAISPDGKYLATGGFDFTAKLWDIEFNLNNSTARKHSNSIYSVDVSPNNELILTGSRDGTAKLWNWEGQLLKTYSDHTNEIKTTRFLPDGQRFISCSADGTAKLWDLEGNVLQDFIDHPGVVNYVSVSPNGNQIATCGGGRDGTVKIWTLDGQIQADWTVSIRGVTTVEFSPDGTQIVTADFAGWTKIWDLEGNLLDSLDNEEVVVRSAIFHPVKPEIYTSASEYPLEVWSTDGKLQQKLFGHTDESYRIAFFPNQKGFVSSSWDKTAIIWDEEGNIIHRLPHPDGVFESTVSKDGQFVLTGCKDNLVRIWNIDGKLVQILGAYVNAVSVLGASEVEQFNDIPVALKDAGIPLDFAPILFSGNAKSYIRRGQEFEKLGENNISHYAQGVAHFEDAIKSFEEAKAILQNRDSLGVNNHLATTYYHLSNHYYVHSKFEKGLEAAEKGLGYEPLDYLKVMQVVGWVLTGQLEPAKSRYEELKDQPTPDIEWYENYSEAIEEELIFLKNQFGIEGSDLEQFLEMIATEPSEEE